VIAKQPAVKKYIVWLSAEERERLNALIQKGKAPARQLLKARILLKADASEAGEAWSGSRIAEALDTSLDTIAPHPPPTGRRRSRGRPDPQTLTQFGAQAHLRWHRRSQTNRAGLFCATQGTVAVDAKAAGIRHGGTQHC